MHNFSGSQSDHWALKC